MQLVQNFPLFSIILSLMAAVITSVLPPKASRWLTGTVITAVLALNLCVCAYTVQIGGSYTYMMGHFPAPWGNEIRIGMVETLSVVILLLVILLSFLGGMKTGIAQIEASKYNIFCILIDLVMLSMQALIYTNDVFTAYVFIEISTLAAAGLVMIRQTGRGIVASMRYMVMNLLGSSLFLIGIVILYTITGHLLMVPARGKVAELAANGSYRVGLQIVVGLITVGLSIKSALYPFDSWLPGAYGNSTPTGSAILSSVVSKGYIFLLIKMYVRVIGMDVIRDLGICDVLFIFGGIGMVLGSVHALRAKTVRMMVAYSSAAQIGYIYMCIGFGTDVGVICALWHLLAHALIKSMLFISANRLDVCSDGDHRITALRGGFYRCSSAGLAFALGAAAMCGVPLLSVFVTKVTMAETAIAVGGRHMVIGLVCLAVSTVLNVLYFMRSAVWLFTPEKERQYAPGPANRLTDWSLAGFIVLNLAMGFFASGIWSLLTTGFASFA